MNMAVLIPLLLKTSIALTVIALGLRATVGEATSLFRDPPRFARSVLAMVVLMPLFAIAVALLFDLHPAVKIALVALAVSPVPPLVPKKVLKAGGDSAYMVGLLVASAVVAIVTIPGAMELLQRIFAVPLAMPARAIAVLVLTTVLAPLAVGLAIRHFAPTLAQRAVKPVALVATVMLVAGVLPILFKALPEAVSLVGNGTLLAIAAFVSLGLAAGHLLGGPRPDDRSVLAVATASRHPGVAIAIAHVNFPDQRLVVAAVVLYLLVGAVLSAVYLRWHQRHAGAPATPAIATP
jgi:bile acid:Na+ symporter, BASS family